MWRVKHKPKQNLWHIKKNTSQICWNKLGGNKKAVPIVVHPKTAVHIKGKVHAPPIRRVRRTPAPDEPLAFCAKCGQWTPMLWLPKEERGHAAETWFECEYCGCRELKLRYVVRAI